MTSATPPPLAGGGSTLSLTWQERRAINGADFMTRDAVVERIIRARLDDIEERLMAERITIGDTGNPWHAGARAGLARALDILREVRSS